jgi:hypothetical protein
VSDPEDFSATWLGDPSGYNSLGALGLLELAILVNTFEFGLAIFQAELQEEWQNAKAAEERWRTGTRLSTVRVLIRNVRNWKRESGWQEIIPD